MPIDLKALSDEELKKLHSLKKKAREKLIDQHLRENGRRNIKAYEPYPGQQIAHECDSLIRIISGGNDSGKTLWGAIEAIWWACKIHPFKPWVNKLVGPTHVMIITVDHAQQKIPEGCQDKLLMWMPKDRIVKVTYSRGGVVEDIQLTTGSITFKSASGSRESLQGGRFRVIWIDEECLPESYWNELITRVPADGMLYMWLTMTPGLNEGQIWMEDQIYAKANKPESDIRMFELSMLDNPHLVQKAKEFILRNLIGSQEEKNARIYGTRVRKGIIYDKYQPSIHEIPPLDPEIILKMKAIWIVIDPHEAKPIVVNWFCINHNNNLIIFDELAEQGLVSQIATIMKRKSYNYKHLIIKNIIDYSVGNKKTRTGDGKSISKEFRDNGIAVKNCTKDVIGGINKVKQLVYHDETHTPRLFITSNCVLTKKQIKTYRWDKKLEMPLKVDDDTCDNIRYLVCDVSFKPYLSLESAGSPDTIISAERLSILNNNKDARMRRRLQMIGSGVGR